MGKPSHNPFITHFSHSHRLELTSLPFPWPPCSACNLPSHVGSDGGAWMYSCRPCNFTLHVSCAQMSQVITHPSHPSHPLTLLGSPAYDGGRFSCDGCGATGAGFSYHCSKCDFDVHALCANKPLLVSHGSHPQHLLKLTFEPPYDTIGFSCDICGRIGTNQWLYRCTMCGFDAHMDCITAVRRPQPPSPSHLHHYNSLPVPHAGNVHHLHHHNSFPGPANVRPIRPNSRPTGPNGYHGAGGQIGFFGPGGQNNNLDPNSQVGPIGYYGAGGHNSNFDPNVPAGPADMTDSTAQGLVVAVEADGGGYDETGGEGDEAGYGGGYDGTYGEGNIDGGGDAGHGYDVARADYDGTYDGGHLGGSGGAAGHGGYTDVYEETYGERKIGCGGGGADLYPPTTDDSQYNIPTAAPASMNQNGPVGGLGNMNQSGSTGGPGGMNWYGSAGQPRHMNSYGSRGRPGNRVRMQNSPNAAAGFNGPNGRAGFNGPIRPNGPVRPGGVNGPSGINGPSGVNGLGNTVVSAMVQGLCQGFAQSMIGGGGEGGGGDGGGAVEGTAGGASDVGNASVISVGSSILGSLFGGGDSESQS